MGIQSSDCCFPLADISKENSLLLLVLVSEILAVALLLLPRPAPHLNTTNKSEDEYTQVQLADKENTQPGNDLKHVVRAGNEVKPKSRGNTTLSGTGPTQVPKHIVGIQICQLSEHEYGKASVYKSRVVVWAGGGGIGTENPVGNVEAGEGPVVGTVLENVAGGHGSIAEAVHKDSLILALQEVDGEKGADEELHVRRSRNSVIVEVQEGTEREEEESWDEEGTEVFNDEDGTPCDLGTY